jgi:hypothetical protein
MADRDDILDVELRIVGQESLGPLAQLTEQLAKITQYQAGMSGLSPEGRAAAARGMQTSRNFPTPSGTAGTHSEPPRGLQFPSGVDDPRTRSTSEDSSGDRQNPMVDPRYAPRTRLGKRIEQRNVGIATRERAETLDEFEARGADRRMHIEGGWQDQIEHGGGGSGSVPPPLDPNIAMRRMKSDLGAFQRGTRPFEYPRFGSMTWQDRALLLSEGTQRIAVNAIGKQKELLDAGKITPEQYEQYRPKMPGTGWDYSNAVGMLRSSAAGLGIAQGVHHDIKYLMGRASGAQDAGIQAGYNKAGSTNIGPFGITNPFELLGHGSAGKESMRQWWTTQRLKMKGGINGEQASEIQNSLAALGWTGNQGQSIALDTISPLVQQGLNPTMTSTMYDKSMRHGNSTVQEFNKTMDKLGESARASKMSLDEFQKGLEAAGDAAKQQGGFYRQGMDAARQFSDSTGLGPQALSQTWGSPLVQGMSMAKYGIMPNAMGTMTGNMGTNSIFSSLDIAKQATSMFATRNTIDPQTGQRISGKEAQYAQMAPLMGMSVEEIRRLDQQAPLIKASSRATGRLDTYTRMLGKSRTEENAKVKELMDKNPSMTKDDARRVFEGTMRSGDIANVGWDSVERSMYQTAGLSHGGLSKKEKKEIDKISHLSGDDRVKAANAFLRDQSKFPTPSDPNTITVRFTGAAERLLMVDKNTAATQAKINAASGGKPSNSYTNSPQGATTNAQAQAIIDSLRATRGADSIPSSSVPAGNAP